MVLAGVSLRVLERPFHPLNANAIWPGTYVLAEWAAANAELLRGRRVLELGSATGALALYCVLGLDLDVTTSDVDDDEVESAIAATFALNGLVRCSAPAGNCALSDSRRRVLSVQPPPPHLPHSWGTPLPPHAPFDAVLASDILLYTKAYPALVATLQALCAPSQGRPKGAIFYRSWQRRLKESEEFFELIRRAGFSCEHLGRLVFRIALPLPELD